LGLSQLAVARHLGITKSLLSLIESGKRQPTEEQIKTIGKMLNLPPALLMLGAGRLPDDVKHVFEADAAAGVAAIRQRTEQRASEFPKIPMYVPKPSSFSAKRADLPQQITVAKTSVYQRAHSYHTKVPPDAIVPFIESFTRPGDTVYDPFCGSGMTGVAAMLAGRNALLSDFSVAAVHIAKNYTTPCDPLKFKQALSAIEMEVAPIVSWMYKPLTLSYTVEYTTWSDIYRCPTCSKEILFWEAIQTKGLIDGDRVTCVGCKETFRKSVLQWVGEKPVLCHVSRPGGRIESHEPTLEDLSLIEESNVAPIPYWIPAVSFGPEREMWRASHRAMGITSVADFFTKRNLHVLAAIRHAILQLTDSRIREALMFAFTACANRASKRYQWNAKRPTNVMTGTLYVSSMRYEWNVWSLFKRKAADVLRFYEQFPKTKTHAEVFQRSAADLDCLPDASIDMVFMDPPFGSNIFYADSSLLWEAWLGDLTDESLEIVINRSRSTTTGGKDLTQYCSLLKESFSHAARILKPSGRAVLAFSNSDDAVWTSVQTALAEAGLQTETVHVLDKGQPSIKGVKRMNGQENVTCQDLMLCLKRPSKASQMRVPFPPPVGFIDDAIRSSLRIESLRTDQVYSSVLRDVMASNYSASGITMPMIEERCQVLGIDEVGGLWQSQTKDNPSDKQETFVEGYLSRPEELPKSSSEETCESSIPSVRVEGGRNSSFYMAHSYHTKVPPEAIQPFIEHYTRPGDVVLDPFCGSGMTGVAAALTGRRAMLNDISPAAVHLAWNHTRPCDPSELKQAFDRLDNNVRQKFQELYETRHPDGTKGLIHWTIWSTQHECPKCKRAFSLWSAIDQKTGRVGASVTCPHCRIEINRKELKGTVSEPAWISYELPDGTRHEKPADSADKANATKISRSALPYWFPDVPLGNDREMYIRCALQLKNVASVADLYTNRNLYALSLLWSEICSLTDERLKRALAFAFTNTAWHGSRMRRFNARGGQRPLTGTLYIPQLSSEANVLEVMRNKISQLQRFYRSFRPRITQAPSVTLGSATNLKHIGSGTVDYVFTDPPFGSNIFYADCNLIWESWLGKLTDTKNEAVVNRSLSEESGGKTLLRYSDLMAAALGEISRVLKPGGWATVVFHNTDAEVWGAIKDAAVSSGFEFHEASSLDRKQQSHKGYKGRNGGEDVAHFDVIFNLRKPKVKGSKGKRKGIENRPDLLKRLESLVRAVMQDDEVSARGLQGVHAEVMRTLASRGDSDFVGFADVREVWERVPKQELAVTH